MEDSQVNKDQLYGEFTRGADQRMSKRKQQDTLAMKMAYKAADIAQDGEEMNISTVNNTTSGFGIKDIMLIGGLMMGSGFAAPSVLNYFASPDNLPVPAVSVPASQPFDIEFAEPK